MKRKENEIRLSSFTVTTFTKNQRHLDIGIGIFRPIGVRSVLTLASLEIKLN